MPATYNFTEVNFVKKYIYAVCAVILLAIVIVETVFIKKEITVFGTMGKEKPIYSVDTEENKVAISFDAAWGADNTRRLMDICDSYNVKATFFLVGFWIEKYPEMVREISERGFEIGNHSENHPEMSKLTKEQMVKEIESVNDRIETLTGKRPKVFRPPYGDYNDTLVLTLKELNMNPVQWSIDSLDWKELGKEALVSRVLKNVKNGDIILCHNNAKYTPDALPEILETLQSRGFTVCPVSEVIYCENYSVDMQGVQHRLSTP